MQYNKNNDGIALIISLIVAFIILALGSLALYISMQSTKISGSFKRYRSSLEAAEGAFNDTRNILGGIKSNNPSIVFPSSLVDKKTNCLYYKLNVESNAWTDSDLYNNGCLANTVSLATNSNIDSVVNYYDLKYIIGHYVIYIKIVNSTTGNTSASVIKKGLIAGGVTTNKKGINILHPQIVPYLYTMIIVSESETNPNDKTVISLLYGY